MKSSLENKTETTLKPKRTSVGSGRHKTTVAEKLSKISFDLEKIGKISAFYGSTDAQLANVLGVTEQTIQMWKKDETFCLTLKKAKEIADSRVVESLYKRATGYEHNEDVILQYQGKPVIIPTVKHYPPDATSMIFWLKNRDKENWRDRYDYEGKVKHEDSRIDFSKISNDDLVQLTNILNRVSPEAIADKVEAESIGTVEK